MYDFPSCHSLWTRQCSFSLSQPQTPALQLEHHWHWRPYDSCPKCCSFAARDLWPRSKFWLSSWCTSASMSIETRVRFTSCCPNLLREQSVLPLTYLSTLRASLENLRLREGFNCRFSIQRGLCSGWFQCWRSSQDFSSCKVYLQQFSVPKSQRKSSGSYFFSWRTESLQRPQKYDPQHNSRSFRC